MLQTIRGTAGTWVVKILFVLLILSFGVWGIGDVIRRSSAPSNIVAEVGPTEITRGELDQEFRRQIERLRPMLGGNLTVEQARQFGLLEQAMSSLVQRALYDLAAQSGGLVVGPEAIRRQIAAQPAFRDAKGQFDATVFRSVLRQNGLTEDGYIQILQREIGRGLIAGAISAGVEPPKALLDALYRLREEKRVAEVMTLANAAIKDAPAPDDGALQRYYEDHQAHFTAPEYRALSVIRLTPDALAQDIAIPDDQLRQAFEERAAEFRAPETRDLATVLVEDEAKAKAIAAAVHAGKTLKDAASEQGAEVLTLDAVKREELPEIGDVAFQIPAGAVGEPVKSGFGWHVVMVVKVHPAADKSFEESKPALLAQMKREKAADELYRVSNQIDDKLAGGAPLEEVARAFNLPLVKLTAVDSAGKTKDGAADPAAAEVGDAVKAAFTLSAGTTSNIKEAGDGTFFAARVDQVTPAAAIPLAEVRGEVVAGVLDEERAKRAAETAKAIAEKLKSGDEAGAQALASASGGSFAMTAPFTREARNPTGMPPELIRGLFAAKPGDVVSGSNGEAQMVARLKEVIPADPAAPGGDLKPIEETVRRGVESDLLAEFAAALQTRYPVTVHRDRIAQMYTNG